jgi:N-acetylneuraminate synthase
MMPRTYYLRGRWLTVPGFSVQGIPIGDGHPPIVVAEIGINHEGSLQTAIEMADAALDAGVVFIKHQTHIPEAEMSEEAKSIKPGNADVSIFEVISRCTLSEADEYALMQHVNNRGGIFFSTPFSREAADRLAKWDIPLFKIGSGECNNYPLVAHIAAMGKPVILSTGMNTIESVTPSVEILRNAGVPFALLHTTNLYPTPNHLIRLGGLTALADAFPDAVLGLSDHSTSNSACIASVALGARILERHFTDSPERPGPDIPCSMTPDDARHLIEASHEVFEASGGAKGPAQEEAVTIAFAFASVVATTDLKPGDVLGPENIWVKRPGGGDFGPTDLNALYGRKVIAPAAAGFQLKRSALEDSGGL